LKPIDKTLSALALASLVLLTACGGSASEKDLLASATTYLSKNDPKSAVIELKNALQINPESPQARYLLGKALLASGDALGAEVELRRARQLKHPDALVLPELARAQLALGQFKVLTDEMAGVNFDGDAPMADLQTSLATGYIMQGARDRAQTAIDRALQLSPKFVPALITRARLKLASADVDGALQGLQEAIALAPGNVSAWMLRADLLLKARGDTEGAVAAYNSALRIKPDLPQAHSALIQMQFQKRDIPAATVQYEAMKKALPNHPDTLLFEAQIAVAKKDFAGARELLKAALLKTPDHPRMLLTAGAVELQLGAISQAEAYLARAVQLAPGDASARRMLARTQLRAGQPGKAISTLKPILDSPNVDADSLTMAGEAELGNGDAKASEEYFNHAIRLRPSDSRARTALALAQVSRGNPDGGMTELRQIAAADPGVSADLALISTLLRRGDFDRALAAIDGLEKKQPQLGLANNLRGQLLLRRKDPAGARKNFEAALAKQPTLFSAVASLAALDLLEKKPEQAQSRFDNLLKDDPKNSQALLALAELKARTGGTPAEVLAQLNLAVLTNPDDAYSRIALINQHLSQKDYKAALVAAQGAVAALPEDFDLLGKLGQVLMANGDTNQAQTTFQKMVSVQPRSIPGLLGLADTQLAAKDEEAAARTVKKALDIAPDSTAVQRAFIMLAARQKRYGEALPVARRMQAARSNDALGWLLEGEVAVAQQKWDAAATAFRTATSKANPGQSPARLHFALLSAKTAADAARMADAWLKDHPKDLAFMQYLGDTALNNTDFPLAEKRYRDMLLVQPDQPVALNNIAWLLMQQGKPGALDFAERAVKAAPEQAPLIDTLAQALAAEKRWPEAIEQQRTALELAPQANALRLNLAKYLLQSGDKAGALVELQTLAKKGKAVREQAEVQTLIAQASKP
jgi:putative PEP-CTERM system TPR-repeat lipoprotein